MSTAVDVHQHLWTPPFVEALRRRNAPPFLRGATLQVAGAAPYEVDLAQHDVTARRKRAAGPDGLARVLVARSAGLGAELLDPDDAAGLLDGYHDGALALGEPFGVWAAANLVEPDPAGLEKVLDRGAIGLELPAPALGTPHGWEACGELLAVLERRGVPLLVHPAPAPATSALSGPPAGPWSSETALPGWWEPVVDYVSQLHAAWFAFRAQGRALFPRLRVCFAALAGLAPLHGERYRARGGDQRVVVDVDAFVETSSYGPRAVDAVVRVLGVDVVVLGSDAPYATAPTDGFGLGAAAWERIRVANADRLLFGEGSRWGT